MHPTLNGVGVGLQCPTPCQQSARYATYICGIERDKPLVVWPENAYMTNTGRGCPALSGGKKDSHDPTTPNFR